MYTSLDIRADASRVWEQIAEVRRIAPHEHGFSPVHAMGFPRPLEATLSRPGVGGIRHARFEGGLVFAVMRGIQNDILAIIRRRCEAPPPSLPPAS